tara:strand:+ start:1025 stop:1336 length:312 start_codon:yes stop_codon:yes gene_type:complete
MKLFLLITLFLMAFFAADWALAQQNPCTRDRDSFVNQITKQQQEVRYLVLVRNATQIFEVYLNKVSGSWTVLRSNADGLVCIMANGQDYIEDKNYGRESSYVH